MNKNRLAFSIALALLGAASQTPAQAAEDLQGGNKPPQALPSDAAALPALPASPASAGTLPGGATVTLHSVAISGNKALSSADLLAQIGPIEGQRLDMAGLNALAARLARYYHAAGYPFAQVYLPPQDLKDGHLRLVVIEGAYGSITAAGKDDLPAGAKPFLDYGLKSGAPIQNKQLERSLLILDDQPGMKIRPVLEPGAQQGQADLTVNVERGPRTSGEVGLDNTGARSTGEYRLQGHLDVNSPFRYGDKIALDAMTTNERMWLGSIAYETPLGPSGLRGQIGYAHTNYQLGSQFKSLDAIGRADVTTARLSFPLIRSQATNVLLSVGLQHKALRDDYRATGTVNDRSSDAIPVTFQFDKRDTLLGGGVTYGSLSLVAGRLDLNPAQRATDAATANTQGSFAKANLDIARIQRLAGPFSFYGRYSNQWAGKNLDSSEQFNLGGYYGVRAYPLGEGVGAAGWFAQLELRYAMGAVTPFAFYDLGASRANVTSWDANSNATRSIAGSGVGLRTLYGPWSVDGTLAWRTHGGPATSDSRDADPRLFVMVGRRF
ncbi:MAG: ShlB/FhaC/HecB family hemolysin secretion/activation protein [Burkholderiales bacterium]|nr:ShlB/FhaC/HecB family hemolysin secretion/activation protein [Burkholderiales bacterium]